MSEGADTEKTATQSPPEAEPSPEMILASGSAGGRGLFGRVGQEESAPTSSVDWDKSFFRRLRFFRLLGFGQGAYSRRFRWSSLVETLVFLGLIIAVNRTFHADDFGYLSVEPHPFWAAILLIAIRYGFRESMLCALLTSAAYVWHVVFPAQGVFHFSTIDLFTDFKHPLLFLIATGFISGYTQHLLDRTQVLRARVRQRDRELDELRARLEAAAQALRRLESRIASEYTSILDLFAELARTKQMDSAQIKRNLLDVLGRYLNAERAVYYEIERDQLARGFTGGREEEVEPPEDDIILSEALASRGVAHLGHFAQQRDLEEYGGASLLAGALPNALGEVLGVVSIERMPFVDYNPHTFKLFETILQWWSSVLDETLRLEELRAKSIFDEELGLYNYSYFEGRMAQEFERAKRFSLPMSVALLRVDDFEQIPADRIHDLRTTLARIATSGISELEMASRYKSEDTLALSFPIAMAVDAGKRLARIVEQVEEFGFRPYADDQRPLSISWALADYEIGMESHGELLDRVESALREQAESLADNHA